MTAMAIQTYTSHGMAATRSGGTIARAAGSPMSRRKPALAVVAGVSARRSVITTAMAISTFLSPITSDLTRPRRLFVAIRKRVRPTMDCPRISVVCPMCFYRNEGDGRFRDVTASAGVAGRDVAWAFWRLTLTATAGSTGLSPTMLRATSSGETGAMAHSRIVADRLGLAVNGQGQAEANMGIAFGDTDGNGLPDVAISHFFGEHLTLWCALPGPDGGILYQDQTNEAGLALDSRPLTGWGTVLADLDLDGHLDLVATNGHIRREPRNAIPTRILRSSGGTRAMAGSPTSRRVPARISRGFTWVEGWPAAISTATATSTWSSFTIMCRASCSGMSQPAWGAILIVRLQGRGANRDAIGARLVAQVGQRKLLRTIDGGGSYLSTSDLRVHFGLGDATQVDRLEVRWPSGKVESRANLPVNTTIEWIEGN